MNSFIHFLLLSSVSILFTESVPVDSIKYDVQNYIYTGASRSSSHKLKLIPNGLLGETQLSLVWKGSYKGETVAIKINTNEAIFNDEMKGFEALNATTDENIESHGIPRIYFSGKFMYRYHAIAMTLLDGTLDDRIRKLAKEKKKISELSILLIFKRAVEILEYLNERNVIHNDIKPGNIFLRGNEVFLSDFNVASLDGKDQGGHTVPFASSRFFQGKRRTPMDDLESLVFSLWNAAGISMDKGGIFSSSKPEGQTLADCKKKGVAKEKMEQKCKQFTDPIVREAFRQICAEEMISGKRVPDYQLIVNILTDAIGKLHKGSNAPRFEWVDGASSSA